ALDDAGQPRSVPPLIVETDAERRRQADARVRRDNRRRGEEALAAHRGGAARSPIATWRRPGAPVAVVGHRGAAGLAPENTLPSYERALACGVDAVECDVHLSKDGVPVVIHDDRV